MPLTTSRGANGYHSRRWVLREGIPSCIAVMNGTQDIPPLEVEHMEDTTKVIRNRVISRLCVDGIGVDRRQQLESLSRYAFPYSKMFYPYCIYLLPYHGHLCLSQIL